MTALQPRDPATRRAYSKRGLIAGLVGLSAAAILAGSTLFGPNSPPSAPVPIGGPFELTDGAGRHVTEKSWPGKYLVVYFGYTFCPDVCPTTLSDLAGALEKLGGTADKVQPLFITVDPRRDTPKVIADYAAAFTPRLTGLTGTAEQIARVAKEYRVYYAEHRTGPGPGDYTMDHSSVIYLIAPDGHFVSVIRADQQADAMAAAIQKDLS
jgi:protein SCO1/2